MREASSLPVGTITADGMIRMPEGWSSKSGVRQYPTRCRRVRTLSVRTPGLQEYRQMLRTYVMGQGNRHGEFDAVKEAVEQFGLEPAPLTVGMIVDRDDPSLTDIIPAGTVVEWGYQESDFYALGYIRASGNSPTWVNHRNGVRPRPLQYRVVAFDDGESRPDLRLTERADPVALAKFKAEVWEHGLEAAARASWCGVFASTMGDLGIDGNSRRRYEEIANP